ncbi:hypothetical protein [Nesterenkonia cremea]|uniref:Uncharacterized protein n=1 Tax=Nesterenkonia cremea TaxID=1882340 RepID=A0A917AQ16_9MICC|nr:hypothetical protein [Nesterenkonia cremea]GGE64352.1 hypothetical protein GCM10011401_09340 [Nesterenkonia cremea]
MAAHLLETINEHLPSGFVLNAVGDLLALSVQGEAVERSFQVDGSFAAITEYIDSIDIGDASEWNQPPEVVVFNLFSVHVMEAVHTAPAEAERLVIGRNGLYME